MITYKVVSRKNMLTNAVKHYPVIAPITPMNLDQIAELISRTCTVSSTDIKAVIDALQVHILDALKAGMSVRLGDLGSFRPTLATTGADTADAVSADNIKYVRCRFTPAGYVVRHLARKDLQFRKDSDE